MTTRPVTSTAAAAPPYQNMAGRGRCGGGAGGGKGSVAGGPAGVDGHSPLPPISMVVTGPAANGSFGALIVFEATTPTPGRATAKFSLQWTVRPAPSGHARDARHQ